MASKPISNLGAVFANLNLSSPTLIPPPPPPSPLSPRPFPLWNSQLIPPPPHIANISSSSTNLPLTPPPSPLPPRPFSSLTSPLIPPPPPYFAASSSYSSINSPSTPPLPPHVTYLSSHLPSGERERQDSQETAPISQAEKVKESGNVCFKAGKYAEALKLYTQAIELDSTNATYYSNRAASYISLRKFRPALEDCQQFFVIAANARHSKQSQATEAKILLRLARCHLALGDPTASLSALKLLSAEFDNVTATHQVQELQAKATLLEAHLIDLNQAREEGEWILVKDTVEACVKLVEDVGTEDEELPLEWWIWSIESDFELRNLDDAMEKSEKTLAIHPTSFLTLSLRARIHLYLGNYELSVKDFEAAIYVGRVGEASREQLDELESEVRIAIAAHEGVQNLKNDANEEDNKGAGEGGHHEQGEVERKNSYYAILGLQRTCEAVEIKKAYKRESLKHHPDKGGDGERFKMISEAYSVLSDTEQRQQYDVELELQEQELNEANREDAEEENASSDGFEGSEGLLALVLFNYTAVEDNEMDLYEGENIFVVQQGKDGWWLGTGFDGKSGLFPSSFVQVVEPDINTDATNLSETEPFFAGSGYASASSQFASFATSDFDPYHQFTSWFGNGHTTLALYDFEATEDNELSFREGDVISQVMIATDDWWKGMDRHGNVGLFPAGYVKVLA